MPVRSKDYRKKPHSRRWALAPAAQPLGAKAKVRLKGVNMAEALTPST